MIRVAVNPDRLDAAAEFFELFKTAWKPYTEGEECTILLSDGTVLPDASASLYILFSPDDQPGDVSSAEPTTSPEDGFRMRTVAGMDLPVYTACRFFQGVERPLLSDSSGRVLAYKTENAGQKIVRVGYDLFDETAYLLSVGQPVANAGIAALDRQIDFLRRCILDAGIPVPELLPCPPRHPYMVCLTHDVDFVSIRSYGLGRTFQGFVRRALFGSWKRVFSGSLTWTGLLKNIAAVLAVPLVHLRLVKDFWMQFDAYRRMEEPNRSTFFLIPFKHRPGEQVTEPYPHRRASRYDVEDVRKDVLPLVEEGWEMGLHGIDAWRDAGCGQLEKERVDSVLGRTTRGIRMHWLCRNVHTNRVLDEAGFDYDSTCGYNETVGFRAGTSQVFKPLDAARLLEVPMHIQDVALFYPAFMNLDEEAAWEQCRAVLDECERHAGVLTVLWHMRSLAPERQWGGFYRRLLERFRLDGAWIGTAEQAVDWFRKRRAAQVVLNGSPGGETEVCLDGNAGLPMTVRVYFPTEFAPGSIPEFSDAIRNDSAGVHTGFYADAFSGVSVEAKAV